jgi:signal transduction histidine kinase
MASDDVFAGGKEMTEALRAFDWASTPLGDPSTWPTSLRTTVGVVMGNRFPMLVWWGKDLLHIYNDGYRPMLGDKHPRSIAAPGREVWAEIWHICGPMADGIMSGGPSTWSEHLLLPMNRKGFMEEAFFTFSYGPVPADDGSVGGVLVTVQETTEQVVNERRLRTLRDLGASAGTGTTTIEACERAVAVLSRNPADVPFAIIYLADSKAEFADRVCTAGDTVGEAAAPRRLSLTTDQGSWPLHESASSRAAVEVHDVKPRFGPLYGTQWPEAVDHAVVIPLSRGLDLRPYGYLVCGTSPRRLYDHRYSNFLHVVADQIANAIANARALEDARARAEALEELDRAKTTFFSNISHEFRTPLTLMLGPTEEALSSDRGTLDRDDLQLLHRNQLRLLKLVNGLLDFSRIEAGRMTTLFQPTDLVQATTDLASMFRSAVERAGLRLTVDCEPLDAPLYVDQRMWEHIVLNLLSNAFKFTFTGGITVSLKDAGEVIELRVADTGIGIAEDDLPQLFRRFHRIDGARSRTHEGSGIGLALVAELVRLHGGTITVASTPEVGTTFTVALRKGSAHLPAGSIGSAAPMSVSRTATTLAQEASRWIGAAGDRRDAAVERHTPEAGARVLIADDNADMREYLLRLLQPHWHVEAVADGTSALAAAVERRPDLILADVMMPGLSGLDLVKAIKGDANLAGIPVMLLSARAGEEAKLEGLASGADEYLVKPFAPRELVARVGAQIGMSRSANERLALLRREQEARREAELQKRAADSANRAKDEFLAILGHELRNPLSPIVTALELMRLKNSAADPERAVIERQVAHLSRLVDDLLDVSRITGGKVQLQPRLMEIAEAVDAAIEMTSPLYVARHQVLTVDVPSSQLTVNADPTRLAQVISNLLSNASKFSSDHDTISISASADAGQVVLRVADRGAGIAPDVLPRVFDLFVQEHQDLDRRRGGLGLGLTIVRNLVKLHHGTIAADSEGIGKGTTFTIRLPLVTAAAATVDSRNDRFAALTARGDRVLIVDDNEDSVAMLATMLQTLGYETRTASDSPMALKIVSEYTPDIAFVDIGLPVVNGYELAKRLRAIDRLANLRLIAFTGYGQSADRERAREAGFSFHLVKPLDINALNEALRH